MASATIQSSRTAKMFEQTVPQDSDTVIELNPYQDDFIFSEAPYPALITAWGTGKTFAAINKAVDLCEQHPGNLGIVFRKQFVDLRDSTCRDFEDYTGMKIDSQRNVVFVNGSVIMFRHLEEMNNIQNVNLGFFWIEQAEELDTDDQFFKLWGRLRRKGMPHTGFITGNTKGQNWIWSLWKQGGLAGKIKELMDASPDLFKHLQGKSLTNLSPLFEAQTKDNAHNLPASYLAGLEILKTTKPKIYNRFVLNSWDEEDTIDVIINPKYVQEAVGRDISDADPRVRRLISIDVARFGKDKIVFKAIENYREIATETHEGKSTMETVGLAQVFARRVWGKDPRNAYAVDEIGVGGGVADRLYELDHQVIFVNAAERTNVRKDCYNRRAEIYVNGAELLEAHKVSILPTDTCLQDQLTWARYKTLKSNGILQVQPKEEIKEDYGESPDDADAFLNGLWAMPQVKPMQREDKYEKRFLRNRNRVQGSGMTV